MGFYSRYIFPRLCDWVMNETRLAKRRSEALAEVDSEILEIGFGTGLNLPHYPEHVRRITAVDPNPGMNPLARRRIVESRIAVDLLTAGSEQLPFEDESFDCVVSTWTLCSISDAERALREVYRVLRSGGRFVFLEHGLADEPGVQEWQRRLTPLQRIVGDGCRLDVDIEALVRSGSFREVQLGRFQLERTPRLVGSMYRGVAVK